MTESTGFMGTLRRRLGKTRGQLVDGVKRAFGAHTSIDASVFEDLEATLIQADLGVETTLSIVEKMKISVKEQKLQEPEQLIELLKAELTESLEQTSGALSEGSGEALHVTLVAGVNGSGKTTTTGKLAALRTAEGKSVVLGAADTFRAAAVEQLAIWAERVDVPLIKHQEGADPAAVAYDATDAALSRGTDYLIIDTAGRLHTKVNLMEELKKIQRVVAKRLPGAPHEVLLVIDATTGQNGLQQARIFTEALDVTGIVLTKLDGTAKGGIVIAIQAELGIPIKLVGLGEGVEDLYPFQPAEFVEALFGD